MGDYSAARTAAGVSQEARQRKWGGGIPSASPAATSKPTITTSKKLRDGGSAVEGRADGGRRGDRKGKKGGKTTVNIVLGGQGQQGNPQAEQMAHQAGMQQGVQVGAKLAAAKMGGAGGPPGAPPGMPPGGGAMSPPGGMRPPGPPVAGLGPQGAPPPMMPGRKSGGRAPGESMKFGAGSGEGRLEKEKMAEKEMRSVE